MCRFLLHKLQMSASGFQRKTTAGSAGTLSACISAFRNLVNVLDTRRPETTNIHAGVLEDRQKRDEEGSVEWLTESATKTGQRSAARLPAFSALRAPSPAIRPRAFSSHQAGDPSMFSGPDWKARAPSPKLFSAARRCGVLDSASSILGGQHAADTTKVQPPSSSLGS